ncbi:DUF6538 domain-containing protein, partial [Burkholderia mallei]|uniref:DUF6538 domain-containing protein n=1 Tax=Burkholderia mallei TaxID=13373 RepID=UPI003082001F
MTNHLLKRGTRYYIRRKIPIDLISHYRGRKEIVKALGTSEPAKARERVREESYRLDQEFAALRQQPAESPQTVELREFVLDPATSESVPSGRSVRLDPRRPGDLPPTNRASRSLVKFVFGEEDEHEEALYGTANHRVSEGSRG